MVPQDNKRIKRRLVPELEADYEEYRRIVEDMVHNGAIEDTKMLPDRESGFLLDASAHPGPRQLQHDRPRY